LISTPAATLTSISALSAAIADGDFERLARSQTSSQLTYQAGVQLPHVFHILRKATADIGWRSSEAQL
jgi:hypothetical protein